MHNSPVTVFWGCWAAMICMSTLSSLMGAILPALLSQRTAHLLCAALFLGFGGLMLWQGMHMTGAEITEEWKEAQHEIQADEEEHEMDRLSCYRSWASGAIAVRSLQWRSPRLTASLS